MDLFNDRAGAATLSAFDGSRQLPSACSPPNGEAVRGSVLGGEEQFQGSKVCEGTHADESLRTAGFYNKIVEPG